MSLRLLGLVAFVGFALFWTAALEAGEEHRSLDVEIRGEDGTKMSLSVSAGFVDGLIEGLSGEGMDCDGEIEAETRAMLEHLSRKGEGSRYTLKRDDGQVIRAHRRHGQLELRIRRPEREEVEISMPWSLGECLLGRRVPALAASGQLEFKVAQDGAVSIRIRR